MDNLQSQLSTEETREQDDETRKLASLTALSENFDQAFSATLLDTWLDLLVGYTADQVDAAVREVIRRYPDERYPAKKLPPFSVVQAALDRVCEVIPADEALPLAADAEWNLMLREIRAKGQYGSPSFCETTWFVIDALGGWEYVCMLAFEVLLMRRRMFVEMWQRFYGRESALEGGATLLLDSLKRQEIEVPGRSAISSGGGPDEPELA